VPTKADNAERFARIQSLMEEYRINHEDLDASVKAARPHAESGRERARQHLIRARNTFRRFKRSPR